MYSLAQALTEVAVMKGQNPTKTLPVGSWKPDQPDYFNSGSTELLNVIPTASGCAPFAAFSADSDALDARPLGAAAASDTAGNGFVYAGDQTKLYSLVANVWTDVSGATYTTPADGSWEFALFNTTFLATNFSDAVQGITVATGNSFADHFTSTLKPTAYHIDVVRDFVVLGNTNDTTDGAVPNRRWWSAIGDPTDFDPAAATQCDYDDAPDIGWCQRVVGGVEYGVIVHERGIERMTYVGSPEVFRFDRIDRKRGTPIPQSVIAHGRAVFFISEEGFMVNFGTGESQSIGHWQVDKEFWNQYDTTWNSRLSTAIDPVNKVVMWSFVGSGATANDPSEIYMFNWAENRWAHTQVDHRLILRTLSQGTTLDGLDAAIGTDIDDSSLFPFSFDSRAYTGGAAKLAGFDTSNQYGFFDGDNLAATIDTEEYNFAPGRFSRVVNTWPLVDGGSPTVAIDYRVRQQDTKTAGSDVSIETMGNCPQNISSRYHTCQIKVPSATTWTHCMGVDVEYVPQGKFG